MIPSVLSQHVEQGIKDFLRTTFPVTTPFFSTILERLLSKPGNIFKGPYLDIQLPFQQGKGGTGYFPDQGFSKLECSVPSWFLQAAPGWSLVFVFAGLGKYAVLSLGIGQGSEPVI